MANATAITLNELAVDTSTVAIVADVLDTGTAAVTLPLAPAGDTHNILLEFANTAQAADIMKVEVLAGDNPPAFLAGLGTLTINVAQNKTAYVVLDSARFMQSDGDIDITITPALNKTQTMTIKAFKLPK